MKNTLKKQLLSILVASGVAVPSPSLIATASDNSCIKDSYCYSNSNLIEDTFNLAEIQAESSNEAVYVIETGDCGAKNSNVKYTLTSDYTLTISGIGAMIDYNTPPSFLSSVEKVVIKPGITRVGNYAFSDASNLKSVTIADTVESIGMCAFQNCTGISDITLPEELVEIEASAFRYCSGIKKIVFPDNVKNLYDHAFDSCTNLEEIKLNDGVEFISNNVFTETKWYNEKKNSEDFVIINDFLLGSGTASVDITIPDNVKRICNFAFSSNLDIKSLTIPSSVKKISSDAFANCYSLKTVTIDGQDTEIGWCAFMNCISLKSVELKGNVTKISDSSFVGCVKLKSIDIPESVQEIGKDAFKNCDLLESIIIRNKDCVIETDKTIKTKINDFCKIIGYVGSTAQTFAKKMNLEFVDIKTIENESSTTTTTTTTTTSTTTTTTTSSPLTELKLSEDRITLKAGEQYKITANQSNLTYSSNNRDVAIVSSNGVITALSNGEAIISVYNSNYDVAQLRITVCSVVFGDIDGNGVINAVDASKILVKCAELSAPDAELPADDVIAKFDINGDGLITAVDASFVLAYCAELANDPDLKIEDFITARKK